MSQLLEEAKLLKDEMVKHRRHLHENPEINDNLPKTVAFVKEVLVSYGYEVEEIATCGLVALVGDPTRGKTILLRADMDALPMKEISKLPFASTNDYAHTCGHDLHTTMLLAAAKILKKHESELNGCVKLMFQPDEEGLTGAKAMLNAGLLQQPHVDAAVGLHVMANEDCGVLACASGGIMASQDRFRINIQGKGGHGAYPQTTIDPINVGVHTHLALQEIVSREVSPQEPLVISVGAFNAGDVGNIIPQTAWLEGTIRALSPEVRAMAKKRLVEICEATATSFRATTSVEWIAETPVNFNNKDLVEELQGYIEVAGVTTKSMDSAMGSEDFAFISELVPSAYFMLGAGGEEACYHYGGMHHPNVQFNEDCMPYGVTTLVACAISWLKHN